MRLLSTRRAIGAALVPLLLVGVSACGSDDEPGAKDNKSSSSNPFGGGGDSTPEPEAPETDEPEAPETDEPEAPETDEPEAPTFGEGDEVATSEFVDIMEKAMENQSPSKMEMTMDAAGQAMEAEGSIDPTDPTDPRMEMTMSMDAAGQAMDIEMVLVDKVMYMKMGEMTGGKFLKMDLNEMAGMAGMGDMTDQLDPSKQMANLEPGIKKVTFEGEESRGDGDAKEYAVTVDTSKVDSLASSPGVPSEVVYNLFFDDEGRMVGMDMDMAGSKVEMTLSGFSDSISIEAPSASEVSDKSLSELMGGGL